MTSVPHISVAIPTCNRPSDLQRCLESLTGVTYPRWDILVIDQSDDARAQTLVEHIADVLPNLTYRHMDEKGLSRARNLALEASTGEILAFLDDDCTVFPNWLEQVAGVFARCPGAALVFGTVKATTHDWREFFIPVFEVKQEHTRKGAWTALQRTGIGASMYIRPSLVRRVGPFDIHLGAGAGLFSSSEDWDYAYRILRAGKWVIESPSIIVEHHGTREFKSGAVARMLREASFADGAVAMKLLRCGDLAALGLIATYGGRCLTKIQPRNLLLLKRPTGLAWIVMYVRGLRASFHLGVDRQRKLYISAADQIRTIV